MASNSRLVTTAYILEIIWNEVKIMNGTNMWTLFWFTLLLVIIAFVLFENEMHSHIICKLINMTGLFWSCSFVLGVIYIH